ncbi:MAG TPA: hypothetical protein VMM84_01750 [Pyrinomonadaceae bacterium]|nr:hypothetical protein [Pyrinomonadaceae bacterium]
MSSNSCTGMFDKLQFVEVCRFGRLETWVGRLLPAVKGAVPRVVESLDSLRLVGDRFELARIPEPAATN